MSHIMSMVFLFILIGIALFLVQDFTTVISDNTATGFLRNIYDLLGDLYPAFIIILLGVIGTFAMVLVSNR